MSKKEYALSILAILAYDTGEESQEQREQLAFRYGTLFIEGLKELTQSEASGMHLIQVQM